MSKVLKNEDGFGAIEILLTLIFLAIVAFIGVYVAHNSATNKLTTKDSSVAKTGKKTNSPESNASTKSATSLTLAQAVSQVNLVYTTYENEVMNGQVLHDKSQWANNNVQAAEDLQFINNHKSWFTPAFITRASNYETTDTTPTGGEFLMCVSGSADFNSNSFSANGLQQSGQTADLTLTYTTGSQRTGGPKTHKLPITVKAVNNTWAIDSINRSSCGT